MEMSELSSLWARIWVAARRDPEWGVIRQGAWYPVLRGGATRLVLDVPGGPVALPRDAVELRPGQPRLFTAVYRAWGEPNPAQGTSADLGRVYAVCPMCAFRIKLPPVPPITIKCRKCQHEEIVAWWETG
jgi:hypothetical protein